MLNNRIKIDTEVPEISPLSFHTLLFLFKTWSLHYPATKHATKPVSDITGCNLSDYMQLPLEPRKVLPETCKHTIMCRIGGVTL